ncbi:hypothetical protein V8C42DRAFT_342844 [Trichoderma barbatum]
MAHVPEHEPHKRKRDLEDDGSYPAHHRQSTIHEPGRQSFSAIPPESIVNFVTRPNAQLLAFLPGDVDTFNDIIYLIGEYEGVLDRKESLAANLGAKLTGPRFLRGLERFFEGPIKIISAHPYLHQVTWLDIVTFAKTNPDAFTVISLPNGSRCCRFMHHGVQVEITEDDWRLISSGALDRFPLEHTFEEDEASELATLEILEQRASFLHKKADELAERARILHHRLELRVHDVARRRQLHDAGAGAGPSSSFHAINHPPQVAVARPSNGQQYDIHTDLLHQFTIAAMQNNPPPGPPPGYQPQPSSPNGGSVAGQSPLAPPSLEAPPYPPPPAMSYPAAEMVSPTAAPAPAPTLAPVQPPLTAPPLTSASNSRSIASIALSHVVLPGDPATEVHRPLVLQKTDTLNKGEIIFPPCDRCRRLRLQCVKHLTACRGCTKKHARCNWRSVTDDEAANVKEELEVIYREAQNAAAALASAKASAKASASASAPQPEADSIPRPASGSGAGPSIAASHMPTSGPTAGPAPMMAPPLAPLAPLAPAPAAEPPRRLLPTTRLTRIEPAPTVPRNPPRTGQLAAILSPPDYEPRPLGTLPTLAPR